MTIRRGGVLVGLLVLTLAGCSAPGPVGVPAPTTAQPGSREFTGECRATELAIPASVPADFTHLTDYLDVITLVDLDSTGRYLLGRLNDVGQGFVLWDRAAPDGGPTVVPVDAPLILGGVNSSGAVVGALRHDGGDDPFLYVDGAMTPLPVPVGFFTAQALTITDGGDVAGVVAGAGRATAISWVGADHQARVHTGAPADSAATGITPDGTVVGYAGVPSGDLAAWQSTIGLPYAWRPDGTAAVLPLPAGHNAGAVLHVRGWWAAGEAYVKGGEDLDVVPVVWDLRAGTVVAGAFGEYPVVDARGDVARASTGLHAGGATLTRDGTSYLLPFLDPLSDARPVAVSDDGTVVVGDYGLWDKPTGVGLLWDCG